MKRFLLSLVALVFLTAQASAVNCFWVGGTGTWDNTNTGGGGAGGIKWASATGGGTACSGGGTGGSPGSSDSAIFDGSSGGGTVTVASTINGTNTLISIDMGAFTGTLDFSVNNPTINFSGTSQKFSVTGTGTRTLKTGTATFNFAGNGFATWDFTTVTNLTANTGSETTNVAARTAASASVFNSAVTMGTINVNVTNNGIVWIVNGGINVTTLNVNSGTVSLADTNATIGTLAINGSSTSPVYVTAATNSSMTNTLTVTTLSGSWGIFRALKLNAAKSISSSYDLGGNTNLTITPPAAGGGSIIGG